MIGIICFCYIGRNSRVKCLTFAVSHFYLILWKQRKHSAHFAEMASERINNVYHLGKEKPFQKHLYGPFLWIAFNCLEVSKPLQGDSWLLLNHQVPRSSTYSFDYKETVDCYLTTKFPGVPGIHLIDLGRITASKPWVWNWLSRIALLEVLLES